VFCVLGEPEISVVEWCNHITAFSTTDKNISDLGEDNYICYCYKENNIAMDLNEVTCTDVDLIC
jgi:hypothetical protein